jgi:hypothetical protein
MQEVLHMETDRFEQVGKEGKNILWHLKPIKYD